MATSEIPTRQRILDAALDLFGNRGVDAVSLDEIARAVGVRKQTVLYWFASKDDLVEAVLGEAVSELLIVVDAALRAAPPDPLARLDALVAAVFRPAVRRPALLGLIGEIGRLSEAHAAHLSGLLEPSVSRAISALRTEMDAGRIRRGDPALLAALIYSTVTGLATEARVLGAVGWTASPAGLRRLRSELRAFVRAALAPR